MPENVASEYVEKVYIKGAELYGRLDWKEYSKVIAELEKTIIRTNSTSYGKVFIQFQNPSMKEMIEQYLEENLVQNEKMLSECCIYYQQVERLLKSLSYARKYDVFYSKVMGKAFEVFDTEDIDIIRRDRRQGFCEKRRYPEPNNEIPRFLKMCMLYNSDICYEWREKYERFLKQYLGMIEMFPHDIPHRCISKFPLVVVHAVKEGLLDDLSHLLEIYKVLVMRNGMQLDYEAFMEFDRKCCMEHVEKHREEIEEYIRKYYDYRLCLSAAENDDEDFYYYLFQYEEMSEVLKITWSDEVNETIALYDNWIDNDTLVNAEVNEEYDNQEKTFDEIESEYWNEYFAVENVDENMNLIMSPEMDHFMDMEYHIKKMFYRVNTLEEVSTENLVDILTELGCSYYETGKKAWRRTDIEQMCLENIGFELEEEQLEQLVESKILSQKNNWFFMKNRKLFFIVFLYQFYFREGRNRKEDYIHLFLDGSEEDVDSVIYLGYQLYSDYPSELLTAMKLIDEMDFRKYVVFELAKDFYEKNYAVKEEQLVENLLDAFEYEIRVDSEGIECGACYVRYNIMDVIELEKEFYLEGIIPAQFTKEQLEKIGSVGVQEDSELVSLKQLQKVDMLKETGIEEGLLKFWEIIVECIKESNYE